MIFYRLQLSNQGPYQIIAFCTQEFFFYNLRCFFKQNNKFINNRLDLLLEQSKIKNVATFVTQNI